jgi:hypothetical protein
MHALRTIRFAVLFTAACICTSAPKLLQAQESPPLPDSQPGVVAATNAVEARKTSPSSTPNDHPFWDKTNDWLFAGVAASRTFDYFSTLNMRRRGRQEILITNDVVDNHAGFAALEAAGTGFSIGFSYWFHRYGHHKLERWTSIVHIGLTSTGAVRNYCLKTAHPARSTALP